MDIRTSRARIALVAAALAVAATLGASRELRLHANAPDDEPPRDAAYVSGIQRQVEMMKSLGMIKEVRDGNPTTVVLTSKFFEHHPASDRDIPRYDGHYVGFAGLYTWLVSGHHNVVVLDEGGKVIGRKTGSLPDSEVLKVARANSPKEDPDAEGEAGFASARIDVAAH